MKTKMNDSEFQVGQRYQTIDRAPKVRPRRGLSIIEPTSSTFVNLPDFPNAKAPQQDFGNGQLVIPGPPKRVEDIQNQEIRDQHINPQKYYPKGYMPELLVDWPVEGDLVVPVEQLPENLRKSMGDRWRTKVKNNKILEEQAKE